MTIRNVSRRKHHHPMGGGPHVAQVSDYADLFS